VMAVDRDAGALAGLEGTPGVETRLADLEGAPWPFEGAVFDAVVVANYLCRPLFPHLLAAIRPGGVLIYETFMRGNERFGRPSNPDFLLAPGELLERVAGSLTPIAFEQGVVWAPKPAAIQRLCAARAAPDAVFLT
jgi:SAM-dependent methyltransferase